MIRALRMVPKDNVVCIFVFCGLCPWDHPQPSEARLEKSQLRKLADPSIPCASSATRSVYRFATPHPDREMTIWRSGRCWIS